MTLRLTLECDTCHKFLKSIVSTRPLAIYAEAKLQNWGYHINAFGIRIDMCPRCQIDDSEEDNDMGDAIDNLLSKDNL